MLGLATRTAAEGYFLDGRVLARLLEAMASGELPAE